MLIPNTIATWETKAQRVLHREAKHCLPRDAARRKWCLFIVVNLSLSLPAAAAAQITSAGASETKYGRVDAPGNDDSLNK